MHIQNIKAKNFRLLSDCEILLEEKTTVIVGRNNSGKTSLTELFRRFLTEGGGGFGLEDFSLGCHERFWESFSKKQSGNGNVVVRENLPIIEVNLTINYDPATDLAVLGDFVIDLEPDSKLAMAKVSFSLQEGAVDDFFDIELDSSQSEEERRHAFYKLIKERIPRYFKTSLVAIDPNDSTNQKSLELSQLRNLIKSDFINAQRGLDDLTHKDNDVLGRILEVLFTTAKTASTDADQTKAQELESAVQDIQKGIGADFNEKLGTLLPAFNLFGYPGLSDPGLQIETVLDVERLLKNHTRVRYAGINGVHLPEGYNGLGARNLVFILLKLFEYFKAFQTSTPSPGTHLVFIEEPEAHLHPQMQEVFINKLNEIAKVFAETYNNKEPWPVQFIVTTHSSHLANKAPFEAMRYFLAGDTEQKGICVTAVKNLRKGFDGVSDADKNFLHQYMTLTQCDLLFADKVILIEGTCERLLMPQIINKVDEVLAAGKKLGSQYISVMEVGGAYAHKFLTLLQFLELPSLIITDLDSVKSENSKWVACPVAEGERTSNACLKDWFDDSTVSPTNLIEKAVVDKVKEGIRISYQVPENAGELCGRTLEDAFILANPDLFVSDLEDGRDPKKLSKTEFALRHAIETTSWVVPKYIKDGLVWLSEMPDCLDPEAGRNEEEVKDA